MSRGHAAGLARETVDRTRASLAASRARLARSDDRVRDTLDLLARWHDRLAIAAPSLPDGERAAILDRWQAAVEQLEIRREMRRSRAGSAWNAIHTGRGDTRAPTDRALSPPRRRDRIA